jgi:hypothetical protein
MRTDTGTGGSGKAFLFGSSQVRWGNPGMRVFFWYVSTRFLYWFLLDTKYNYKKTILQDPSLLQNLSLSTA